VGSQWHCTAVSVEGGVHLTGTSSGAALVNTSALPLSVPPVANPYNVTVNSELTNQKTSFQFNDVHHFNY